jgi:hypothetical protein
VINSGGRREADMAVILLGPGQPKGIDTGWVTDISPAFDVTVTGGLVEDA